MHVMLGDHVAIAAHDHHVQQLHRCSPYMLVRRDVSRYNRRDRVGDDDDDDDDDFIVHH